MYLALVMDLFSRRIVGWHIDKNDVRLDIQSIHFEAPSKAGWCFIVFLSMHC